MQPVDHSIDELSTAPAGEAPPEVEVGEDESDAEAVDPAGAMSSPDATLAAPKAVADAKGPHRLPRPRRAHRLSREQQARGRPPRERRVRRRRPPPRPGLSHRQAGTIHRRRQARKYPDKKSTYSQKGKGEKKKKVAAEVVEEVDPYAALPLFIGRSILAVRLAKEMDSEMYKDSNGKDVKLAVGSLMRVIDEHEFVEGITKLVTKRMKVILDGDSEPVGWVTGLSRDGNENLRLAAAGYPLRRAIKPLICREAKETSSKKLDDIPKNTHLRVIEEVTMSDGSVRAKLGKGDTPTVEEIGWITLSKPGDDDAKLEEVSKLTDIFDLKVHTAASLTKALKSKQASNKAMTQVKKKKRAPDDGGLPFQPMGRGPAMHSADDGTPSRHAIVNEPAKMVLMVNCTAPPLR